MNLIGCAGQARNGKDETANYLAEKLGWYRGAFAFNVKRIFCDAFNVTPDFIEKWKTSPEIPEDFLVEIRKALQFIGDGFRQIKDGVWIDMLFREGHDSLIISDIRYTNELRSVKDRKGLNVLIYRPGYANNDTNASESQIKRYVDFFLENGQEGLNKTDHPEFGLVDFFIINDGSIEDLHSKIDTYIIPYVVKEPANFF